ncbi:signal peptide peptidase-like 2B [Haemaphysalis longicornis]
MKGTAEAVFEFGFVWFQAPLGYAISLVLGGDASCVARSPDEACGVPDLTRCAAYRSSQPETPTQSEQEEPDPSAETAERKSSMDEEPGMDVGDDSKLAIVSLFTGASNGALCVKYFPAFKVLPGEKSEATARPLTNMVAQDGCQPLRGINLTDAVVLINDSGRCSLENVSRNYYNVGAYGLLVGLSDNVLQALDSSDIEVQLALTNGAAQKLLAHLEPTTALTFTKEYELDAAIALIWFIAVFCVGAGGFWAGSESHHLYYYHAQKREERQARRHAPPTKLPASPTGAGDTAQKKGEQSEQSEGPFELELTPRSIICFVIFMSSMLLVLYVFIRYLVYVIIGMFVLASAIALIGVLEPALPCFFVPVEVRQLLLIVFSVAVSFSFVVFRNESWSWILQGVLGTIFSVYMIKTIRMPSLQRIHPHNTTNSFAQSAGRGDSVIVEVATGGGTGESVPMVMRVPRFTTADMAACMGGYSLLGLGDILIPGQSRSPSE